MDNKMIYSFSISKENLLNTSITIGIHASKTEARWASPYEQIINFDEPISETNKNVLYESISQTVIPQLAPLYKLELASKYKRYVDNLFQDAGEQHAKNAVRILLR
jgi:hypothetical protein